MNIIKEPSKSDILELSRIHSCLFDYTFTNKLGIEFLEKIYYPGLLDLDFVFTRLFIHDNKILGYAVCTTNTDLVFSSIVKKRLSQFLSVIFRRVLLSPSIIKELIKAFLFVFWGQKPLLPGVSSEIVNMGVLPQYRKQTIKNGTLTTTDFFKTHKIKVAQDLFLDILGEYKKRGVREMKVLTPAGKVDSNKFYSKVGCRLVEENINIMGQYSHCYYYKF